MRPADTNNSKRVEGSGNPYIPHPPLPRCTLRGPVPQFQTFSRARSKNKKSYLEKRYVKRFTRRYAPYWWRSYARWHTDVLGYTPYVVITAVFGSPQPFCSTVFRTTIIFGRQPLIIVIIIIGRGPSSG